MKDMRVLVSGVAGDIGFGAVRILKEWGIFNRIFGIDITDDHPASLIINNFSLAPSADNKSYINFLKHFLKKKKNTLIYTK